ncbi:MAG: hypothetical protein JXA92_13420 [candidate division Zixibacteria bacterium]|nr:hypothetical protein [candidate division Zixibacteria bacterium]
METVVKYLKTLFFTLTLIVLQIAAGRSAEKFSLDGYYKIHFVTYDFPSDKSDIPLPVDFLIWAASTRARVNAHYNPFEKISFAFSYSFMPRVSDPVLPLLYDYNPLVPQIDPQGYRVDDLKNRIYPDSWDDDQGIAFFQNLDRAFVTVRTKQADFFIGRQAIAWGSARVINPTDIIAPFTYDELDAEDRLGVDAVRMRLPLGFMGELDAGYIAGSNLYFDRSSAYVRTKFYAARTDVTLIMAGFRENLLAGFDIARALGGAGFWTEAAYVWADALSDDRKSDACDYFRGTVGLDYSFGDKTYGFLEYHFNGAGAADTEEYLDNITTPAYTEGAVYLMGRHYLIPGLNYQLTPLFTLSGQLLVNLTEPSGYLTPQFEYNVSPNIYINGGAFIGLGKYPVFTVDIDDRTVLADLRSEFGSYTNTYFTSLRVYF